MNRFSRRKKRGFSLIEVLFAIFLVMLSASIVVATMPTATRARVKADYNNKATSLAQKMIETVRGLGYANVAASPLYARGLLDSTTPVASNTYSFTNVDSTALDEPSRILPAGTGTIKIEQVDIDLRRITVTVSWTERGTARNVVVGTLVANL